MIFNPFLSLINTISLCLRGHIKFPKNRIREIIWTENGEEFTIFRQVIISPGKGKPAYKAGAIFRVRFIVAGMSAKQNRIFSLFPIPFFIGLPGFQSKLWLRNHQTGESMGRYEWESREHAARYSRSFAMRFMTMRAMPGSISYSITDKSTS